ncbi:putative 2-aminoethylphosphonate ABC transporter, ATP-binding protein, partial [Vibrio parahaemolyticus 861]
TAM